MAELLNISKRILYYIVMLTGVISLGKGFALVLEKTTLITNQTLLFFIMILTDLLIFYFLLSKDQKSNKKDLSNLNFRIGGVGIKNVDYEKVVSANNEILTKLAGTKFHQEIQDISKKGQKKQIIQAEADIKSKRKSLDEQLVEIKKLWNNED